MKLDGSDQLTPLSDDERPIADSATATANEGERVSVLIKNHTATVTGNVSSPAARSGDVEKLGDDISKIQEFDILIGEQIQAQEAYIKKLQADKAEISELVAAEARITELVATKATIEELDVVKAVIDVLDANKIDAEIVNAKFVTIDGDLEAINADFVTLEADYADFKKVTTNTLTAYDAEITRLDSKIINTDQLNTKELDTIYANIDFANIGESAIRKLFSDSGIIKDLIVSEGHITGELVGVTIKGDLIEAGTLKADRLVVKGSDGNYYKLNTDFTAMPGVEPVEEDAIHGSTLVANSITAEKIAVDDLVAFDATIGGFEITGADKQTGACASIHSFAKSSADSSVQGIYLGSDGQMSIGDSKNFLRYFKDTNGEYKLEISANSMSFSTSNLRIGARNLIRNSTDLVFSDYRFIDPNEPDSPDVS